MKKILFSILILSASLLLSQEKRERTITQTAITGYRNIALGMSKNDVIKAINDDPLMILPRRFKYISDIDIENIEDFISLQENKFFKSGYFLFKDDALYAITITFQEKQASFLETLSYLNSKYGMGNFLDAETVAWQNGDKILSIERPTIIKYMIITDYDSNESTDTNNNATLNNEDNKRRSLFEGL